MIKIFFILSAVAFAAGLTIAGDNPVTIRAIRVTSSPRIDGFLGDDEWKLASPADQFTQRDPEEGKPASEKTEIRVLYDDEALYFGCMFYDSEPEKIGLRKRKTDRHSNA